MYADTGYQAQDAGYADSGQPAIQQPYVTDQSQAQAYQQAGYSVDAAYQQQPYDATAAVSGYTYDQQAINQQAGYVAQPQYPGLTMHYTSDGRALSKTTVYVSGLPAGTATATAEGEAADVKPKFDEAALHNFFFSSCGPIKSVRLQGNKGFCFIEFETEEAAAAALALSGCQAALSPEDPSHLCRLTIKMAHARTPKPLVDPAKAQIPPTAALPQAAYGQGGYPVDYQQHAASGGAAYQAATTPGAYAPVDYWQQQAAARPEPARSPSPTINVRYTDGEMKHVKEILKSSADQQEFYVALKRLTRWMEGGDCSKKTVDHFHSCLQTIAARARAFRDLETQRRKQIEEETKQWASTLVTQCDAMSAAMVAGRHQRVRDLLSKPQRKNLEGWCSTVQQVQDTFRQLSGLKEEAANDTPPGPPQQPPDSAPAGSKEAKMEGGKRRREEGEEDATKVEELEGMLVSRDGMIRNLTARVAALEAELAARPVVAPPAAPDGAPPARPAPLQSCIQAALTVYLLAQPQGAPVSDLALYITRLGSPAGRSLACPSQQAIALTSEALASAPGVFRRTDTGLGEPLWSMSALLSLPQLLAQP